MSSEGKERIPITCLCAAALLMGRAFGADPEGPPKARQIAANELPIAYIHRGSLYCGPQRVAVFNQKAERSQPGRGSQFLRLYRLPFAEGKVGKLERYDVCEINNGSGGMIGPPSVPFRWRINDSRFWGTGGFIDDGDVGVFWTNLDFLERLCVKNKPDSRKTGTVPRLDYSGIRDLSWEYPGGAIVWEGGSAFDSDLMREVLHAYWSNRDLLKSFDASAGRFPGFACGIFFDFLPQNLRAFRLFILFGKDAVHEPQEEFLRGWPRDPYKPVDLARWNDPAYATKFPSQAIEVWNCQFSQAKKKSREPFVVPLRSERLVETIATPMQESFYVFEKNDDYYFLTYSRQLWIAPKPVVDEATIQRLIRDLDAEQFEARDKAQKDLLAIGKPALKLVNEYLGKAKSLEQKKRLGAIPFNSRS